MTTLHESKNTVFLFRLKDFYSAITHIIGFVLSIIAMPILLCKVGTYSSNPYALISCAIYAFSMILLYGASSAYHSFNISSKANDILKRIDHMSIFILIAGTYTPICTIALKDHNGIFLLILTWSIAIGGICFKYFFVHCPKWVSSILYLAMGWICIFTIPTLIQRLSIIGFIWLLLGGLFYTIGAFLYAKKKDIKLFEGFGNHEIFHCFVMLGSLCHFIVILNFLPLVS